MKHYESISNYNDMLYDSRPVTINEYLSDKYNIIHKELFNDALNKYIDQYISKFINYNFLYNIYSVFANNTDYIDILKNLEEDSLIYKSLYNAEINQKYLLDVAEILNTYIDTIIDYLINNDMVTLNNDMLKLTTNDIWDFRKHKNNIGNIIKVYFDDNGKIVVNVCENSRFISNDIIDDLEEQLDIINTKIINDIRLKALEYFKKSHRIIEIKNIEYWMPSEVIIIHNSKPFTKNKIDLTKYWNNYQKLEDYDISKLKISNENILDSEVTYLDYIKGTAHMFSKSSDISYEVPFKYLNENSNVSEDMKLTNTFSYYI